MQLMRLGTFPRKGEGTIAFLRRSDYFHAEKGNDADYSPSHYTRSYVERFDRDSSDRASC